ncbi:MAG: NblA/ycf18 family protein [Phormidesmis sp.]
MIGKLTIEQELELKVITDQAKQLSLDQAQRYIVEAMRQMMVRDNLVEHLLGESGLPQEQYSQSIIFQGKPLL